MALETLLGVHEIGGFKVRRSIADDQQCKAAQGLEFVEIVDNTHELIFRLQRGPIKEYGVNGCQVDTIIVAAQMILEGLNKRAGHPENELAIASLGKALEHLQNRTNERVKRGVEGTEAA